MTLTSSALLRKSLVCAAGLVAAAASYAQTSSVVLAQAQPAATPAPAVAVDKMALARVVIPIEIRCRDEWIAGSIASTLGTSLGRRTDELSRWGWQSEIRRQIILRRNQQGNRQAP